ncbi:Putative metal-binding motif-containing protein [Stigmatella aurantiaca]|uniref:Putative metal-binding motif-containing protein n=1 Tax=Stigmatella aurantiaca TaxID=41 RepID=A0A1H7TVY1_STIAU|nr:putative metal-binding motif-containing protein [Stigmatella aurantiaca]SEL88616.1 Putative metal-binding motif-containing protein [Stigmatella aurantiaca]
MFRFALFSLMTTVLLSGCSRSPGAREAAVKLTVTYNFKAKCLVVTARDRNGSGETTEALTDNLKDFAQGSQTAVLAVFRKDGWSRTLNLTATAYESPLCKGPALVERALTVELPETQVIEQTLDLAGPDGDEDGYIADSEGGTDCDDAAANVHPSASEVCDDQDNNCDGNTDEGVGTSWYPDQDGDGFGDLKAAPLVRCTQPAKHVQDHSDCLDSNANAYPRKDFTETTCDEVDDDCNGTVDDTFPLKETACEDPCPSGTWVCNSNKNGLACQGAPPKEPYYPDADGDGEGDEHSTGPSLKCPKAPFPQGTVANKTDCDDQDPLNARGNFESCDARDNNCNTTVDEDNACMGKGWKSFSDDAAIKDRQWKSVSIAPNGWVWVAGDGGKLAVRKNDGVAFSSLDGACGNTAWKATWTTVNGIVVLAGDNGQVAWHDGTNCHDQQSVRGGSPLTSVIGRAQNNVTQVYAVNAWGELYSWTQGSTSSSRHFDSAPTYLGVHTLDGTGPLLLVGGANEYDRDRSAPLIADHPGSGNETALTLHTLPTIAGYGGYLTAVWMVSSNVAYAVGDKGLILKWDGNKTWSRVNLPNGTPVADYTSVVALDPASVYVTDMDGRIRLLKSSGWAPDPIYDGPQPLRDIAAKTMNDIWAVGDNGLVVHFAE